MKKEPSSGLIFKLFLVSSKHKKIAKQTCCVQACKRIKGEWRNNGVKHPCKKTERNSCYQIQLPKLTNGKKQMVKIYYLPFLFIEYLEFSKMHYNLFNCEIQIISVRVGFYFLLSIVLEKWLLMVFFGFFQVKIGSWLRCKPFFSFSSLEQNWKSTECRLHFLHAH